MAKQLLIYETATPVNRSRHANLAVKTGNDFSFAANVNSVPLMVAEFSQVANEMAIVFAGNGEDVIPAVLLGIRENENLFIDDKGKWLGKYVPAFLRRYPFVFSSTDEGQNFTLCIDESFEGANNDGRGERLFDADGEQTQYLKSVLGFLQAYQVQFQRTKDLCGRLRQFNLLEPMQAQFTLPDGRSMMLSGFEVVSRDRLKAISSDQLAVLFGSDDLEVIYLHLQSLRNLQATAGRLGVEPAEPSAATAPEPVAP
ncbi:multidrug transporter [Devosia insulae DS-56]|uniref:Multidrug transporter n=1 Tax=Devosia insulae DS-56 TaxID=1116389 RepID=A0A1E5XMU2_9HYPH|nr:SapC family protein [Devosia insulae]OEO29804.1 multidrug transporter [Devosia insulae DS-56]